MKITSNIQLAVIALLVFPVVSTMAQKPDERGGGKGRGEGGPQGQGRGPGMPPLEFNKIDTDKSGDVNKAEWTAFHIKAAEERAERSFAHLAGDDEKISETELSEMANRRGGGEARPERRPGAGNGGPGGEEADDKAPQGEGDMSKGGKGKGKGKGKGDKGKSKGGKGGPDTGSGVAPKRPALEE